MSLNWDISKVKNFKKLCWNKDESLAAKTEGLLFATMYIGIGHISEKNCEEFFERLTTLEYLTRPMLWKTDRRFKGGRANDPYTLEDVRRHIGLSTNASHISASKWRRKVADWATKKAVNQATKQAKLAAAVRGVAA